MHPMLKIVVMKIRLDVDVIVFFFSCLCCDLVPLRFYVCPFQILSPAELKNSSTEDSYPRS
jgi:hypothetical protein